MISQLSEEGFYAWVFWVSKIYLLLFWFSLMQNDVSIETRPQGPLRIGLEDKGISIMGTCETHTAVPTMSLVAQSIYQVDHGRPPLAQR